MENGGIHFQICSSNLKYWRNNFGIFLCRNRGRKPIWLDTDTETDGKEAKFTDQSSRGHTDQTEGPDTDSQQSDNEDESSLSLTKHLPEDIEDDNVEDLVRAAEKTLDDAETILESDIESKSDPSNQAEIHSKLKVNDEPVHSHKALRYLRAAETIEYQHDELDLEADDEHTDQLEDDEDSSKITSEQYSEHDNENVSDDDVKDEDYEGDFDNDGSGNELEENDERSEQNVSDSENVDTNNGIEDNENDTEYDEEGDEADASLRCWCDSLRKLNIQVPDEVTLEWLYELSLVTIPDEVKSSIPGLIAELQEKLEVDDPQEEFKLLRTVEPTDDCTAANLAYNRDKNRFRNVLPCKFSYICTALLVYLTHRQIFPHFTGETAFVAYYFSPFEKGIKFTGS